MGSGGPSHAGAYPPCPPKLLAPHTPPRSSLPASPAIIRGPVHTPRRLQPPLQAPRLTRASPKRGEEDVTQKPVRMHVAFGWVDPGVSQSLGLLTPRFPRLLAFMLRQRGEGGR